MGAGGSNYGNRITSMSGGSNIRPAGGGSDMPRRRFKGTGGKKTSASGWDDVAAAKNEVFGEGDDEDEQPTTTTVTATNIGMKQSTP